MLAFLSPGRLARRTARHPWLTMGFWLMLVVAAVFSASSIKFDERQAITGTDSDKAQQAIDKLQGGESANETVVVESILANVDDPAYRSFVTTLVQRIRALPVVKSASTYYETNDPALVNAGHTKTIIPIELNGRQLDAADNVGPLLTVLADATKTSNGFSAITAGDGSINRDLNDSASKDLEKAELVGLPAALVVLIFVFGAAAAAGVPVVLGLIGILVSVGVTATASKFLGIGSVTINLITMIGLAVGIDYTLFIVERFREERARGVEKIEAIVAAGNTASRAVLFSGITVIIALTGLLIVPSTTFRGMAVGAISVVMAAMLAALTLLPAVLSLLGDKLNWLHLPGRKPKASHDDEGGFWGRSTALVMRHPLISIAATGTLLLALAAPAATIKLGNSGVSEMPTSLQSVQAFRVLDKEFSAGRLAPAEIVIEGDVASPGVQQSIEKLRTRLAQDSEFGAFGQLKVSSDGKIGAVNVIVNGDATEPAARKTVERLRHEYVPAAFAGTSAKVYVGGNSAGTTDYIDTMNQYLPIVIGFVLALSFVLLLVVFRSIVIPVKAIIMNLLSVGAAYGLLVIVFQHGVGADLFGFQQSDTIAAFLPIFLFTILFGLSMDYHVFLLSRIQERFLQTGDNTAAVGYGLRSTAHIITGAAAIMMVVFGGFALGSQVELQQAGFGLAVAVFLDATIVRSILVPASMEMLGDLNWYLPKWLAWLPKISVEGGDRVATTPARPATATGYGPEAFGVGGD